MIVGHYAAALLPWSRLKDEGGCPFWLLLLSAQVPEFLWLALALAGVEAPRPASLLDASFSNIQVEMLWSHNLVPALVQAAIVAGAVFAALRRARAALACGGLVLLHVLCDYVVGFEHQVLGRDSPRVALDSYGRAPELAILFELGWSLACIFWYHASEARRGRPVARGRRRLLYAVFAVGILMWLPAARTPLRALFGPR
jgi:hypothetical protein